MDETQAKIVRKRLKEEGLEAQTLLDALVQTLTKRHVDCEYEKKGRPMPTRRGTAKAQFAGRGEDALDEFKRRNAQDDPEMAKLQEILFGLLIDCQFAAEKNAGLDVDPDDPPTHMRLVKD